MPRDASMRVTAGEVRRLCGEIEDIKVTEIVATGATVQELEEAFACLHGDDSAMAEMQRPLSGRAAQIYDILAPEEEPEEEM